MRGREVNANFWCKNLKGRDNTKDLDGNPDLYMLYMSYMFSAHIFPILIVH